MTLFDHEQLDFYQRVIAFIGWLRTLFEEFKEQKLAQVAEVCDHLDRAGLLS
jgi:hypothetical protein